MTMTLYPETSELRKFIIDKWSNWGRKPLPTKREIIGRVSLRVYDAAKIKEYMKLDLKDAISKMVDDAFGELDEEARGLLKTILHNLAVRLKEEIVRPRVEARLEKNYDESYIDAITISLLAIFLGLGGEIKIERLGEAPKPMEFSLRVGG